MSSKKISPTLLHVLVSWVGWIYIKFVEKTTVIESSFNPAFLLFQRKIKPHILAFWHNTQVSAAYGHTHRPSNALVSRSKDGEYIAQVLKRIGIGAIRGSSSRGGDAAFREILAALERGEHVGFTPDGPRGPIYSVNPGVVRAAQMSQSPLVMFTHICRRKIEFNSWDRFVLPLPFGYTSVAYSEPIRIPKSFSEDDGRMIVKAGLDLITKRAEETEKNAPSILFFWFGYSLLFIYRILGFILFPLILIGLILKFGVKRSLLDAKERCGWGEPLVFEKEHRLWFHAASIGEWQALKPVLREFVNEKKFSILVTTSSPEAKKLVIKECSEVLVSLLPVDLYPVMKQWIKKINPDLVCVVETEIWPNMIQEIYKNKIPLLLINGRLSKKSVKGWSLAKPVIRILLRKISFVIARGNQDRNNFLFLGADAERVESYGNSKADNLLIVTQNDKSEKKKSIFGTQDKIIVIAGSTWPGEESLMIDLLLKIPNKIKLILAPRKLERLEELKSTLSEKSLSFSLWSTVKDTKRWDSSVLLVDTFGDLKNIYTVSDVAFVGGSVYPRGGQNPFEPAAARLPLFWGPSMSNFEHEAKVLLENGAAIQVKDPHNLVEEMTKYISEPTTLLKMGDLAAQTLQKEQGASKEIAQFILRLFSQLESFQQ